MKVKIRKGARIYQDFSFHRWPECAYAVSGDVDTEFDAKPDGDGWECVADGYGAPGEYGNGAIIVRDHNGVDVVV